MLSSHQIASVLDALHRVHPYEQPAYYLTELRNTQAIGSGIVGVLSSPLKVSDFLDLLSECFSASCIRHTSQSGLIEKVAFCGGSGSFLIKDAADADADAFVSSDFRYHDFFDAPSTLLICDIGHAESEEHVKHFISEVIKQKFPKIAVNSTSFTTNPIHYFTIHGTQYT